MLVNVVKVLLTILLVIIIILKEEITRGRLVGFEMGKDCDIPPHN